MPNRLAESLSPYLAQHADNPVDWFPWSDEAFDKARAEDKPIFLSIGYSTCHWCHVMAHESFEDEATAELINRAFVPIKVDREERPDVDGVYMAICQALTGSGGWPLTIVMTPDKEPFFAATYIPRETRYGRIGLFDLIPRIEKLWSERRSEALDSAHRIVAAVRDQELLSEEEEPSAPAAIDHLERAFRQVAGRYDAANGGFGQAPKFPTPHNLTFLLRHLSRTGDTRVLEMVEKTLTRMHRGGIFDQVGFGFHRYSTDRLWLLPHFEKMLYDQALIAIAASEAFQAGRNPEMAAIVRRTMAYVFRDLAHPEGGFHSAEDADSEGEEGKFYVWTKAELEGVLGAEDADLAFRIYNVEDRGNFRDEATREPTGANILHLTSSPAELAEEQGLIEEEFSARLDAIRQKLLAARAERVRPGLDDKILTDWNGLMIAALARAGRVLAEPDYLAAATKAAQFVLTKMRGRAGLLRHRYRAGDLAEGPFAEDYAYLTWGLIELHQATLEPRWLRTALELTEDLLRLFRDDRDGAFFTTPEGAEELPVRLKEIHDSALPAANSVALVNLLRLARLTGRVDLEEAAAKLLQTAGPLLDQAPIGFTHLLAGVDLALTGTREVVIVGPPRDPRTQAFLDRLNGRFLPRLVTLLIPAGTPAEESARELAPFTAEMTQADDRPTAYLCQGGACQLPTIDPDELLLMIGDG